MREIDFQYNIEAQAGIISSTQRSPRRLKDNTISFGGFRVFVTNDQEWVQIGRAIYPKKWVDVDALSQLVEGEALTEVLDVRSKFTSDEGEDLFPVAALLLDEKVIFKSPYFNLERYLKKRRKA